MNEQKRQRIMLGIMAVLVILVVLNMTKKKGSSGSLVDKITGGNLEQLKRSYNNAVDKQKITLQEQVDFNHIEEEILNLRPQFWSYTKSGTPRGDIQQHLRNLAKTVNLDSMRVSTGFERPVSGCEYIRSIDFSVSDRNFDMKRLAEFLELIDKETVKYYWNECKIYMSGKTLAFSGSIRVYVFSKKAVSLFGRKS